MSWWSVVLRYIIPMWVILAVISSIYVLAQGGIEGWIEYEKYHQQQLKNEGINRNEK